MTTARTVRPTDLVALVSFDGRIYPNEAHTWDRLGRDQGAGKLLESALEQWLSFATGRHTWISTRGQTIRGVVSARQRGSRLAWEVDCLVVAADEWDGVLSALLEKLCAAALDAGTLRLFLRIEAGSDVQDGARKHGFVQYTAETLYRLDGQTADEPLDPAITLRPRNRTDGFPLFRLYNAVTPVSVRMLEAATYAEWIAAQEKRSQGRGRLDVVAEHGGEIVAWLRAVPDGEIGRLDLLVAPEARQHGGALLAHAARWLGGRRPLFCLVPAYAEGLAGLLEERGFVRALDYAGLVKRLAVPVKELAPARRVAAHQPLAMV